jgi:plastocyanin
METEKSGSAGKVLGVVVLLLAIAIPAGIAAEIAVPNLQAGYQKSTSHVSTSTNPNITPVNLIMPAGVSKPGGGAQKLNFELVGSNQLTPNATVVIGVNNTIIWTNQDDVQHTTTAVGGLWNSGAMDTGQTFSVTISAPGTYEYHCTIHPKWMIGFIIVKAPSS